MFEPAKGSWPFTRACYGGSPELDVRDMPIESICVHIYSASTAARSDGVRFLIIHHGPGEAAEEVRTGVQHAVRSHAVDPARCSQIEEGFIAALKQ